MSARNVQRGPGEAEAAVPSAAQDTQRRRAEAEGRLLSADWSFEACLDGMVDGVLINRAIRDENGRIVDFWIEYANEAASGISGVAHEALVGHRILDLIPGRRENGQFDAYVRVVETGEPLVRNSIRDHAARRLAQLVSAEHILSRPCG